ncbi:MAG: hypothetical protein RLZZ511_1612 [Cyanobacteriota bacterium]|jgi:ubiquinone/menaquinone biosynthesis C-methylase UbiE
MSYTTKNISQTLQDAYNDYYLDSETEWRELGAKYKAENILNVCADHQFSSVLECGAGEGSILKFLNASDIISKLYALEISDSGINQIIERQLEKLQEVRKFDGYTVPYPDMFFDMAYCSHVIEHVEHPRILLRELKRVSKYQVFEIPLDYSIEADQDYERFLKYGHINIYTPTTFRFLLKSEGYEILAERLTDLPEDVIRFNWYENLGVSKTLMSELKLKLLQVRSSLKKILYGKRHYKEYGYAAYTCFARGTGEMNVF